MRRRQVQRYRRFVPVRLALPTADVRQMSRTRSMPAPTRLRQHIRYATATDGRDWRGPKSGAGPLVVKAANWLTHLEYEWESPVWKHWIQFFSSNLPLRPLRRARLRHDASGMAARCRSSSGRTTWALSSTRRGQTDRSRCSASRRARRRASATRSTIRSASSRMILYGGYARGALRRGTPDAERRTAR